jgi:hypothetical protein
MGLVASVGKRIRATDVLLVGVHQRSCDRPLWCAVLVWVQPVGETAPRSSAPRRDGLAPRAPQLEAKVLARLDLPAGEAQLRDGLLGSQ